MADKERRVHGPVGEGGAGTGPAGWSRIRPEVHTLLSLQPGDRVVAWCTITCNASHVKFGNSPCDDRSTWVFFFFFFFSYCFISVSFPLKASHTRWVLPLVNS